MSGELKEYQARRIVQTLHRLRHNVTTFAIHANTLKMASASFDGLALLDSADQLLRALQSNRDVFEEASSQMNSLSRSLSSRPTKDGGMPPAAKWGNEFRAGSKQFIQAVNTAERALASLYAAANEKMSSPTRTPTGAPENLFDIFINFVDALSKWIESRRGKKH
jgi:hypothetical protein